jgi:hypothetical protein
VSNSNIQHPTSREALNSKHQFQTSAGIKEVGDWCFSGAWSLEFGILRSGVLEASFIRLERSVSIWFCVS